MLYIIWLIAVILLVLAWIFRQYIFNVFYTMAVIIDRVKAFGNCMRNWFLNTVDPTFPIQRRKIDLDESEDYYWRD